MSDGVPCGGNYCQPNPDYGELDSNYWRRYSTMRGVFALKPAPPALATLDDSGKKFLDIENRDVRSIVLDDV